MKLTPLSSTSSSFLILLSAINIIQYADAWTTPQKPTSTSSQSLEECRREFLSKSVAICSTIMGTASIVYPESAMAKVAADSEQMKTDKQNIVKGFKRLDYLLTNWEKETTICGRTDNPYIGCERTPEKVMDYLGFKSMNDPLFRVDKTLLRLQPLVAGTDAEIDYMEAMDFINQAVEDGNGIAFVSSWGEANPGGGKDRIDLFIERSRLFVKATRDGLGAVINILDLKVE